MIDLSICIATRNRADYIGQTLDSILRQVGPAVELVIVDGASADATEQLLRSWAERDDRIRYHREPVNSGVDQDYDRAVRYARGTYCWLMTDDDLLVAGAVSRVLRAIAEHKPDVVLVDGSVRDLRLERTLRPRRLNFSGERRYGPDEASQLLSDAGELANFIGSVIVRRAMWCQRDPALYFGTLFAHVGVIFSRPGETDVVVIGEPLVTIRLGNSMWTPRRFEIWARKWPQLIWGLDGYPDAAKAAVTPREPWRSLKLLASFRAKGALTPASVATTLGDRRLGWWRLVVLAMASAPGRPVHLFATGVMGMAGTLGGDGGYELLESSPYRNRISSALARRFGLASPR